MERVANTAEHERQAFVNAAKTFPRITHKRSHEWFYPCVFCETNTAYICRLKNNQLHYVCPQCQKVSWTK